MSDEFLQDGNEAQVLDSAPGNMPGANVLGNTESPGLAENIQMVPPSPLGAITKSKALVEARPKERGSLFSMMDVPVELVMEVGRTDISVEQLMELVEGSIIDLRKVSVDSIEVRMNEKVIAQAEAISLQQRYGIRFTTLEKVIGNEEELGDVG